MVALALFLGAALLLLVIAWPPPATPVAPAPPATPPPAPAPTPAAPPPPAVVDPAAIGAAVAAALEPRIASLEAAVAHVRRRRGGKPKPPATPTTPSSTGP